MVSVFDKIIMVRRIKNLPVKNKMQSVSPIARKNLDGLTAVRFFAAFWVFIFHFHLRIPLDFHYRVIRIIENGALAMPIFFMLSGLVLGYRYHDKYDTFSAFYRTRIARIYPAYIMGVLMCIPFLPSMQGLDAATLFFIVPVDLLLIQAWYPNLWHFWHHAGTWSISVEFFLYASFPLFLGLSKVSTRLLIAFCTACVLLAGSWIPSLGIGASKDMPLPVFYAIPIYSLPAFMIGVALAELHRRGFKGYGSAPIALMLVLGIGGQFNSRYAGLNLVTLPLIAFTLLFAAAYQDDKGIARIFINRGTIYLGDLSYAFFVYQIPIILALEHYIKIVHTLPVWLIAGLALVANLSLAAVSHHWLEPWGRRLIMKGGRKQQ